MAEMKLTYFSGRGRAEVTRYLFKIAGRDFIDKRITGEQWPEFKKSKSLCHGQSISQGRTWQP